MNVSNPLSLGSLGLTVWSTWTPRQLTSLLGPISVFSAVNQTLAASTTFSFTPAASAVRTLCIGVKAGAAGTAVTALFDGTTSFGDISTAASQTGVSGPLIGTSTVIPRLLNNDAVNAATYCYVGYDIT